MAEVNLLDKYPQTRRPIEERANLISDDHRRIAKQFGRSYFDGERLYGYGGYHYHPRFWQDTVKRFRDHYRLSETAKILDVGCAKGYMLYDFKNLMPELSITGIDISSYAIEHAKEEVKPFLKVANAKELPFADSAFDLVISINTIHNLERADCFTAVQEIQRVSKGNSFLTVDAWRDDTEKERLLKWNLTAQTYMHVDAWKTFFQQAGYTGDFYWFIAA